MRDIRLRWMPGRYAVCKLAPSSDKDFAAIRTSAFVSITRTADEISIVVPEADVPPGAICEGNWIGCAVEGPLPFELVGVLARLTSALAAAHVPVFVTSTFETDFIFVNAKHAARAHEALLGAPGVRAANEPLEA